MGPEIEKIAAPNKTKLFANDDVDAKKAGMQVDFRLRACGLPQASAITCTLKDDDGKAAGTLNSQAHADLSGKCGEVKFGVVTIPDGEKIVLTCTTADGSGNSTTFSKTLVVLSSAADVRITVPLFVADKACTKTSQCGAGICVGGKCATPWGAKSNRSIGVTALGVLKGATARLCTNGPAAAGAAACSVSGYKIVAVATTNNLGASFDGSLLKDGTHRVYAEIENPAKPGKWATSLDSTLASDTVKYRHIYVDTVPPNVTAVLPPTGKSAPAGCLSQGLQDVSDLNPGGKFTFAATLNEAGSVALYGAGQKLGSADAEANKPAGISIEAKQEGGLKLTAVATDLVGNESAAVQVKTGKATEDFTFTVDTLPPTGLSFTSPTKSPLIIGDTLDVSLKGTDADTAGAAVALFNDGKAITPVQKLANQAVNYAHSAYGILKDGSHKLTATVSDTCGNSATVATSPTTVVVDTKAPTANIVSPADKANFGDADDEDKNVGGYQVKVTYSTSGATKWKLELGTDCDANFANCKNYPDIAQGTVTNAGGNEPAHTFTIPFGVASEYSVRLTVWDENGNAVTTSAGFKVQLSGCLVAMSGHPLSGVINTQSCPTKGKNCADTTLNIKVEHIGPCGTLDGVKLFKIAKDKDGKDVETELASVKPASNIGTFSNVKFNDGDNIKIEGRIFEGTTQKGSSGPTPLLVDLSNPVATFVAATVDKFDTPESGKTALWGKSKDVDGAKNKHQFHARLKITDVNIAGGSVTALTANGAALDSNAKLPIALSGAGSALVDIKHGSIGENTTTTVKATVTDGAGNVGTAEFAATVDWVAPGKITLTDFKAADLNPRRPYAKLNFTAVADNGSTGSPASTYEVRYSKSNIADDTAFDNACDAESLAASSIDPPKQPGKADSVMVEGPDQRAGGDVCKFAPLADNGTGKFYFAMRAVDAAGNKGPMSNVISTADIRLRFAKISGTGAPMNTTWHYRWVRSAGDINGDGKGDLLFGGVLSTQMCILYGHANADLSVPEQKLTGASGTNHSCMGNTTTMGGDSVANIDVNGDGQDDLIVSAIPDAADKTNRKIYVFLGEKGKPLTTTPALTIEKIAAKHAVYVASLWHAGNFNGDKTAGGQPVEDFAFTILADGASYAYNRVIVVPGSTKWSTSNPVTINIEASADRKANNIATVHLVNPPSNAGFGVGVASMGNLFVDGDGSGTQYDDLAIGVGYPGQIVILKGQVLNGEVVFALTPTLPANPTGADAKTARIFGDTIHNYLGGFSNPEKVSIDGDSVPDMLVVKHYGTQQPAVYWLRGVELAKLLGKSYAVKAKETKKGSGVYVDNLGWWAKLTVAKPFHMIGNFFDRPGGYIDMLTRRPGSAKDPDASTVGIRGAIVRPDTGQSAHGSYAYEDVTVPNPFNPGVKNFGTMLGASVGDFNGDGRPDFVVGTASSHSVLVY